MSYLDLAKQARARQMAATTPPTGALDSTLPDEINELTKKPAPPGGTTPPPVQLRSAFRGWFILVVAEADGAPVDALAVRALHQQIVRLTDEVGPLRADALYADELRRFRADTARCGLCGGLGHDQEPG